MCITNKAVALSALLFENSFITVDAIMINYCGKWQSAQNCPIPGSPFEELSCVVSIKHYLMQYLIT